METTNHHCHHRPVKLGTSAPTDDYCTDACHGLLIAVPFKWETQPGVPRQTLLLETDSSSHTDRYREQESDKDSPVQSLPPPPRLTMRKLSNDAQSAKKKNGASMDSPRSLSISKKMKSLFQTRLGLSSSSSPRKATCTSAAPQDLDYVSEEPMQQAPVLPFQNMSSMLMELWYGDGSKAKLSDSSLDLESPTSSSTDNSVSSFSSDSSSSSTERRTSCYYDFEEDNDDDEDFSMEFVSSSSREFFANKFYSNATNRFHVDSSESASLLGGRTQRLPSALKKVHRNKVSKCVKKVRFAEDDEEQNAGCESPSDVDMNPVLSRHSSRSAPRYVTEDTEVEEEFVEDFSPSPRTKRDLSELLMQIIQNDIEFNKKHSKKSMFRSRW